ncbi:MAG TPA: hypothetical protein DD670_05430 [Planctomycetaceae bacterium]|nr:hypothetical protein [Planctomycetaceae bacterium]
MQIDRYFYITTLSALGELGTAPPMGIADLTEHVSEHPRWRRLVGAMVLFDDLRQREAFLAGEIDEVDPSVLTVQQARNEAPLPDYLLADTIDDDRLTIESDRVWASYFRYASKLGREAGSRFLTRWVGYEVALRNALAAARARRLGLEEAGYQVAAELADDTEDLSDVIREWESAATPLEGHRIALRARWDWIGRHDAWFSFSEDELFVHAARVMLLEIWLRSVDKDEAGVARGN